MTSVRTARATGRREVDTLARVLGVAFADDPIARWLLPDGRRIEGLFRVLARYQHGLDGGADLAEQYGVPVGAALWDHPDVHAGAFDLRAAVPLLRVLRTGTPRAMALEQSFLAHRPAGDYWYLASIGAVVSGTGIGSALLESRLARISGPAYLESSKLVNVPLYERFGFEVLDEVTLPRGGPPYWPMWRPAG